jgi:hypothetical protein
MCHGKQELSVGFTDFTTIVEKKGLFSEHEVCTVKYLTDVF